MKYKNIVRGIGLIIILGVVIFSLVVNQVFAINTNSLDLEHDTPSFAIKTDTASLSITGDLSIWNWIKFESVTTGGNQMFANKWGVAGNISYFFGYDDSNDLLRFLISADGSGTNNTSADLAWEPNTGTWYHVAFAYDASAGTVQFYLDGSTFGSLFSSQHNSIYDSNQPFALGINYNGGTSVQGLDGKIDDVRVYDAIVAPTPSTIIQETIGVAADIQGYWKLNDDNYVDQTANNNDLTPTGSPVFSVDVPFVDADTNTTNFFAFF